jgi:hypothetical protein
MIKYLSELLNDGETFSINIVLLDRKDTLTNCTIVSLDEQGIVLESPDYFSIVCLPWSSISHIII